MNAVNMRMQLGFGDLLEGSVGQRHLPGLSVLAVVMQVSVIAHAGPNFPPEARITVESTEVLVREVVSFSALESSDPDDGPQPLSFSWDFDDGTTSDSPTPQHAFSAPRAHIVELTVDDGVDSAITVVTVHVLVPRTSRPPSRSAPIALAPDETQLWVVNEDSNSVSLVELSGGDLAASIVTEIPMLARPRTLALDPDGTRVFVTEQSANQLAVIDVETRAVVQRVLAGHEPYGVAVVPDGRVLVSLQGQAQVLVLDGETLDVQTRVETGSFPRSIAVSADGTRALVTRYISGSVGEVCVIDLESPSLLASIELAPDTGPDTPSSGRGIPNILSTVSIHPGGKSAWVGGLKSNVLRGLTRDGLPLIPTQRVRAMMAKIEFDTLSEVLRRRIDVNNADTASDIAFSPNGRYAYVTHQGAGSISVYDLSAAARVNPGDGSTIPFSSRTVVGEAPIGAVVNDDGTRIYVLAFLSRGVFVLDAADPACPQQVAFIQTTDEPLTPSLANGKRLFHRSSRPVHSSAGYIACASCHPDGGMHDGQTWDFSDGGEGLRNTIDLRGRSGMAHGPVHWSANFDEIQDFENDIVHSFGGTGLAQDGAKPNAPLGPSNAGRSQDLDDLAAYVASLSRFPRSPHRGPDGELTEAALRGREVFFRADTGCTSCHPPPRFTDSVLLPDPQDWILHDVGTIRETSGQRLAGELTGIDTPTLKGLWATAPYLHDGSAPTLRALLLERNLEDRHGSTSHLSEGQISDLILYLLSLDDRESAALTSFRRADANCDGKVNIADALRSLNWLFQGGTPLCCAEAADANDDGGLDLSDAISTLLWLFADGGVPPEPGPHGCGVDPAPPGLGCSNYPDSECGTRQAPLKRNVTP